jgi:uncharacterized protein YceK
MRRISGWLLVGAFLISMTGCGTLYNNEIGPCPKYRPDMYRVYGGVRKDLENLGPTCRDAAEKEEALPLRVLSVMGTLGLLTIDLGLSAVGDTITLPRIIAVQIAEARQASAPADAPPSDDPSSSGNSPPLP